MARAKKSDVPIAPALEHLVKPKALVSVAQKTFWKELRALPKDVQRLARLRYKNVFRSNPRHQMLMGEWYTHRDKEQKVYRVEVGHYRALAYYTESEDTETFVWYWIGSHETYNGVVKQKLKKP